MLRSRFSKMYFQPVWSSQLGSASGASCAQAPPGATTEVAAQLLEQAKLVWARGQPSVAISLAQRVSEETVTGASNCFGLLASGDIIPLSE